MGGAVCNIRRQAILKFQAVPTDTVQLAAFDEQVRKLYAAPDIAETIVSETTKSMQVCATLAKTTWGNADRAFLFNLIESLYEGYAS